jgi:hypothetical protein
MNKKKEYVQTGGSAFGSGGWARKVIQITACCHDNVQSTQSNGSIIALCNDGTLFMLSVNVGAEKSWIELPPIPQAAIPNSPLQQLNG